MRGAIGVTARRQAAVAIITAVAAIGLAVPAQASPLGAVPEFVDSPQGRVAGPAYLAAQFDRARDQQQHEEYQAQMAKHRENCPADSSCTRSDPYVAAWSSKNLRQDRGVLPSSGVAYELLAPREGARSAIDGRPLRAPYPGVVLLPGGGAAKEEYRGMAQGLAAAGYVVLSVDPECNRGCGEPTPEQFAGDAVGLAVGSASLVAAINGSCLTTGCDYGALAEAYTGSERSYQAAGVAALQFLGEAKPALVDRSRIGFVGHSLGAYNAALLAQRDDLPVPVGAAVAWDGYGLLPADAATRVPVQFQVYESQDNNPHPFRPEETPSHANARRLQAAGVPTGVVALRSSTHYEVAHVPYDDGPPTASRKGERVALDATLSWLETFLGKGRSAAAGRQALLSDNISSAVDALSHGQGTEAADGSNVPYTIAGEARRNHLSLLLRSWYDLADGTVCADLLAGCG